MDGKACLEVQLPMSKDDNKIELKTHEITTNVVFIFVLIGVPLILFSMLTDAIEFETFEPLESDLLFESAEELGYNWTEENITVFETSTGWSSTMYEKQCENGIEEACDYMLVREVAREAFHEEHDAVSILCFRGCVIWPLFWANLIYFGRFESNI